MIKIWCKIGSKLVLFWSSTQNSTLPRPKCIAITSLVVIWQLSRPFIATTSLVSVLNALGLAQSGLRKRMNDNLFIFSHNAALEDVRSRHHHRRSHHYEKGTSTTSTKVVLEVETDSTPVSSDVEQNPSPRRSCQRKRKERRDSIGEGQDKKFSKSSR